MKPVPGSSHLPSNYLCSVAAVLRMEIAVSRKFLQFVLDNRQPQRAGQHRDQALYSKDFQIPEHDPVEEALSQRSPL